MDISKGISVDKDINTIYSVGDIVEHRNYGRGTIVRYVPENRYYPLVFKPDNINYPHRFTNHTYLKHIVTKLGNKYD